MRLCQVHYEKYMQNLLYKLGLSIGKHPWRYIICILTVTFVSAFGFVRFKQNNDARKTFTDSLAQSRTEGQMLKNFLGANERIYFIDIMILSKGRDSLKQAKNLEEIAAFVSDYQQTPRVKADNNSLAYTDICEPFCMRNYPLELFLEYMKDDIPVSYPRMEEGGEGYFIGNTVYNVTLEANSSKIEDFKTLIVHITLNYRDLDVLHKWELEVIKLIDSNKYPHLEFGISSEQQLTKEVQKLTIHSAPCLLVALIVISVYLVISASRYDRRESKHFECLLGGGIPVLAAICTVGMVSATGYPFQSIVVSVLFLIIAIGIDDVFLMLSAWHRTDKQLSVRKRIAGMMQDSGSSMTVTSLTNLVSFGNGVLSTTSALQCFAIYATVASVVSYLFQLIIFPAILAITAKREYEPINRKSCIPPTNPPVQTIGNFRDKVFRIIAKAATSPLVQALTLLALLGYWALSIYGLTLMETELAIQRLVPPTSPFVAMRLEFDEVVKQMQTVAVLVNNPGDLRDSARRERLRALAYDFETADYSYGNESTIFWLSTLEADAGESLKNFSYEDVWITFGDDDAWKGLIKLHNDSCIEERPECIESFVFTTGFVNVTRYTDVYQLMLKWRAILNQYPEFDAYSYTERSDFAEASASIGENIWWTIASEVLCMGLVFLIFIPDLASICAAMFALFSVNLGVLGFLNLWGVGVDPFSLASLLMSIGFSVDICAHISYHFYQLDTQDTFERINKTLQEIGFPTMQGAFSTIIACLPILFDDSYLLHVFLKTIILVNLLSVIHGLFIIPAILSVFSRFTARRKGNIIRPAVSSESKFGPSIEGTVNITTALKTIT